MWRCSAATPSASTTTTPTTAIPVQPGPSARGAGAAGYADHTVDARHLGDQLRAQGLDWKDYYESLPQPGSDAVVASDPAFDNGTRKTALYASQALGLQELRRRAVRLRASGACRGVRPVEARPGRRPAAGLCARGPQPVQRHARTAWRRRPADCDGANLAALIRRGDAANGALVRQIMASRAWRDRADMAIVVTFDEGSGRTREGCCGVTPGAPSNFGGGHIPTLVITNHGPRGVRDDTPYSHYSLLRTIEDAFGIGEHLRHADDGRGRAADDQAVRRPRRPDHLFGSILDPHPTLYGHVVDLALDRAVGAALVVAERGVQQVLGFEVGAVVGRELVAGGEVERRAAVWITSRDLSPPRPNRLWLTCSAARRTWAP